MTWAAMALVVGFVTMTPDLGTPRLSSSAPGAQVGPFLNAGIGACSTEFAVKDGAGQPIVSANIHMHLRYGLMGLRRMDLAIGTGHDGRARIEGLPADASWLLYDIDKGKATTQVQQDVRHACQRRYDVTLK